MPPKMMKPRVKMDNKTLLSTWKKIFIYSKKYIPLLIISIILTIGATILTILGPDKLKDMTNLIQEGIYASIDIDEVGKIGITLIIFYSLSYLLNLFQGLLIARLTVKLSQDMRNDIERKINQLPMSYFSSTSIGNILSIVTNDVDTVSRSIGDSITTLVSAIILFIGSLIMMFVTNYIMAFSAIISSLIGLIMMFIIMGRSQKYFIAQQNNLGSLNGYIEEMYSGHNVVIAYNATKNVENKFDDLNDNLKNSAFKAQALSGLMMPIMNFVGNFGYVVVCVVGGVLALNDSIEIGVIVSFMMYIRYFTQPLSQIAQAMQTLQSAAAAGKRAFDFLEADELEDESYKEIFDKKIEGNITFEHVKFSYDGSTNLIIKDFSLEARKGQKIAIVGPTGAGKTTLVNLLMRFYEINDGKILIDGKSTKEMRREDVHELFCMVLQDTWLFEGSVLENLTYSNKTATMEEIKNATKAVGLHHFIKNLPNGYETILDDSITLSSGQKQQLTIARAMIANRPMLILDEATSNVDTRTELKIQKAMDDLTKNKTSFVIAHRLSTIKNADVILVLNNGDIIEKGNHNELMKLNGFYADLYNSQFVKI